MISCALCGTSVSAELPPLTWASSLEAGRRRYFCDRCSRENARNIETRLDQNYW